MASEAVWQHIIRILSKFDFEKVRKMMEAVDWKWGGPHMNGNLAVPTVEAMESLATSLMLEAIRQEANVSSGGFEAYWIKNGEGGYSGNGCVGLRFVADYRY